MNTTETKKRIARARRHAERLGRSAIRDAGKRGDVGRALGRSRATVSHDVTSRAHPDLKKAFEVAILLIGHPGTNARPLAEAMLEACELSDIVSAETETLVARGLFLLDREDLLEADENRAARTGVGYSVALRAEASAQMELAAIVDELAAPERGSIDLLEVERSRSAA